MRLIRLAPDRQPRNTSVRKDGTVWGEWRPGSAGCFEQGVSRAVYPLSKSSGSQASWFVPGGRSPRPRKPDVGTRDLVRHPRGRSSFTGPRLPRASVSASPDQPCPPRRPSDIAAPPAALRSPWRPRAWKSAEGGRRIRFEPSTSRSGLCPGTPPPPTLVQAEFERSRVRPSTKQASQRTFAGLSRSHVPSCQLEVRRSPNPLPTSAPLSHPGPGSLCGAPWPAPDCADAPRRCAELAAAENPFLADSHYAIGPR
jgi:hypothetical protein